MDAPRPAATLALLRDSPAGPEVLLTHRPATMAFGPGLHVFPGGGVDPEDADPRLLSRFRPPPEGDPAGLHGPQFAIAAIREAWEEAGILLASPPAGTTALAGSHGTGFLDLVLARDLELRGDWLVPLSRWVTPPVVPRRYDARVFVAWLPDGAAPVFDAQEVAAHEWLTPAGALEAMADGRIELWPPTSTTLQQLAGVRDLAAVRRLAPVRDQPPPVVSAVEGTGGLVTRIDVGGAGGIPGSQATTYIVGRRRLAIVDPGDPNDDAADAVLGAVEAMGATVSAVLVTVPVPNRAAGAEGLALRLGVPVHAWAGASRVLSGAIVPVAPDTDLDAADVAIRAVGVPAGLAYEVAAARVVFTGGADGPWPAGWATLR